MLLKRYGTTDFLNSLHWLKAIKLINKATEEKRKENLYKIWLVNYSKMTKETYVGFDQWYNKITVNVDITPKKEILNHAENIRKRAKKNKEADNADI